MSLIEIKRPVMVKVIMTEKFRKEVIEEAEQTIKQIEENLKSLELRTSNTTFPSADHNQQMMVEKERLIRMKAELDWKIKEVQNVNIGAELPFRVFEGNVDIKVGDNFVTKISKAEIVLKDWEVVEVREG